ncbi:MAG TPA: hypothetical protein ACFYEK_06025 [Candidatus Wunengus sp. YC60]|uniref:hypothetical protein n=1 Tax=Candidatus Wunengus sp. YC60 TaxID=3367697 RepID=UPI004027188B
MDEIKSEFQESKRNSEVMVSFGSRLYNQFTANEGFRFAKEQQWLEDLRAYKGLYDPDVKISANASKVYPKLTRSKVNIVLSRLHEMLFPENDKNFEIKPTPEPKISPETVKQIVGNLIQQKLMETQVAMQEKQLGTVSGRPLPVKPVSIEDVRMAIQAYAKSTCESMSSVIDDQLFEMDYPEETKKVLKSGLLYGTGIMKGPMINKRTKHKWEPDPNGDYQEAKEQEDVPYFESIRIWDWYPDMTVTEMSMIEGSFERHLMSKHDIRELIDREDYYGDIIKKFLTEHPNGNYVPKNWETQLQVIEMESGAKYTSTTTSYVNTEDTSRATNRQIGKKYEVLEYWGYIDGSDLEACGVSVPDVTLEYAANVWMIGKTIISARLFDGALNRYKIFYYEKDETSLYGEGLARVMRHSQIAVASSARMVLDNSAVISGPQVEVNWSLLTPGQDMSSFYPRKIWYREGRGIEAQYPAIRNLSFDSHVEELIGVSKFFMEFADIETTLPTWLAGQMVNNETAQAASGRMATITISIKDIVKNFDMFTEHIIQDLYAWNMEFNPRSDIKGDYSVKARGVSSLIMKEIRMQAINQFMATLGPEDLVYIPRRELLTERLKVHDININLKTEEEAQKLRDEQSNSEMAILEKEMLKSEIAKNRSQAMSNLTKAKQKNVEANKDALVPPEQTESEDPRLADEAVALSQTERTAKEAQIRRDEERHAMELSHADEDHNVKKVLDTTKAVHDITLKNKKTDAEIKAKEESIKIAKKQKKVKEVK